MLLLRKVILLVWKSCFSLGIRQISPSCAHTLGSHRRRDPCQYLVEIITGLYTEPWHRMERGRGLWRMSQYRALQLMYDAHSTWHLMSVLESRGVECDKIILTHSSLFNYCWLLHYLRILLTKWSRLFISLFMAYLGSLGIVLCMEMTDCPMGLMVRSSNPVRDKRIFLYSETSRSALGPTWLHLQWITAFFPRGKAAGRIYLTTHRQCSVEVKNEWSYSSTLPTRLNGVDMDKFVFHCFI